MVWFLLGDISGQHSIQRKTQLPLSLTLSFLKMTRSTALGMLRVGNTGEEILQILDVIVADIEQENINDCAEYFASISAAQ